VEFANPVFLVGKNGAGKSNILDALDFLRESATQPLHTALDQRGGIASVRYRPGTGGRPVNLGMRVEFDPDGAGFKGWYAFEIKALPDFGFQVAREECNLSQKGYFKRNGSVFESSESGIRPLVEQTSLALPLLTGTKAFRNVGRVLGGIRIYAIEPAAVSSLQEPDNGRTLKSDGSNLASVVSALGRRKSGVGTSDEFNRKERICELLASIVPGIVDFHVVRHGTRVTLEFTQDYGNGRKTTFEAHSMSDGTLRALAILTAAYQYPVPRLLAIEEPESTIHPEALGTLLDELRSAATEMQVVVTTHSPELLDAKWIAAENLRVVVWENGVTKVLPLGEAPVEALKRHLMGAGELFRSNALDGLESFAQQKTDLFTD
jgi:predicted ATPase